MVITGIQRPAEWRGERELISVDEIAASNFRFIDIQFLSQYIDHALYEVNRLSHPQRAAVRNTTRCLVGEYCINAAIGIRNRVRACANGKQTSREFSRGHMRIKCAMISQRREAQSLDHTIFIRCQLPHAVVVAREAAGGDILHARLNPFDRHTRHNRRHRCNDIAGIDRHLVTKAAANISTHDADLALGNAG